MRPSLLLLFATVLIAGCTTARPPSRRDEPEYRPTRTIVEAYDLDHDGTITRAEMEKGLGAAFAKADAKHTACLDNDEARAVNQERWEQDQSTYSPLVDFKGVGCIDFDEFAATARSLFEQMDRNGNGKIEPNELRPPSRRPQGD